MVRRSRWLTWTIGTMLAIVATVALLELMGWPFLRGPFQRALADATGRQVELGPDFSLRLIGSIRLRDEYVEIGQPPPEAGLPAGEGPFVRATQLRIELPYSTVWRLLRGPVDAPLRVSLLEVDELNASLARDAEGKANWSFADSEQIEDAEPSTPVPLPQFDRFEVRSGEIRLRDELLDLQVNAQVRTHEGTAATAADGGGQGGADAGLEIIATGTYRDSSLHATLRSPGILPLAATGGNAPPVPFQLQLRASDSRKSGSNQEQTVLELNGQVSDLLQLQGLTADYRLRGPSLAAAGAPLGLTLPATSAFDIRGSITKDQQQWSTRVEALEVGSSRLNGEFAYDAGAEVAKLSGTLRGEHLALSDLGPALGAGGGSEEEAVRKRKTVPVGRVLPHREFDIEALSRMNADLRLDLDSVDLGSSALASIAPLRAHLSLDSGVLAIAELDARTASGELRGLLRLDGKAKQPHWHVDLRVSRVRLEQFLTARTPGGIPYLSGTLGGRAKLDGHGNSTAEMLGSLDGSSEFWINGGKISQLLLELSGIDIAESLGLLIGGDGALQMQCAAARLTVEDGLVTPEVALIDTVDTTLLVTGESSLAEERLDLVITARPKDASPLALRSPVHIEGTFGDPKVRLDMGATALRLGAAALLATIATPAAALLALIDPGAGDEGDAVCAQSLQRLRGGGDKEAAPRKEAPERPPDSGG
ncbi:MAG TPA: AsmA family protein [Burkholderiaceae bacterium]|nr:AsmA family protein [Burkholderiaceae bacterium]